MNEKNVTNGYKKFEHLVQQPINSSPIVNGIPNGSSTQLIANTMNGTNTADRTNTNNVDGLDDIETMLANLSTQLDAMLTQGTIN